MSLRADFVLGGAHVEGHIQLLIQLYHSISYPNSLIFSEGAYIPLHPVEYHVGGSVGKKIYDPVEISRHMLPPVV